MVGAALATKRDVRFGSLADIKARIRDVRFAPKAVLLQAIL
jgi:hypothetical protein